MLAKARHADGIEQGLVKLHRRNRRLHTESVLSRSGSETRHGARPVTMKHLKVRYVAAGVIVFFLGWALFVNRSGSGHYLFGSGWDFTVTGQLGDSFGVVSAVMTSLAAIFTYQTMMVARKLATDEKTENEARDAERQKRDAQRDADLTYFRLLEARAQLLNAIETGSNHGNKATGQLAEWIRDHNKYNSPKKSDADLYASVYDEFRNSLGHYFRFTYHIVVHVTENLKDQSYNKLRILRAQLSNSELVLLALNCAYGEGQKKFKPLVERYALLHNIDPADRIRFNLDNHFKPRAFGLPARKGGKVAGGSKSKA